jgi:hypothetical protein
MGVPDNHRTVTFAMMYSTDLNAKTILFDDKHITEATNAATIAVCMAAMATFWARFRIMSWRPN